VSHTQYSVVKEVMKDVFKYKLSTVPTGDWDLMWADTGVNPEIVSKMKPYQKINHFPNMGCLARKNQLGRNLGRMRKAFKKDYNFFPPTWLLPGDWNDLRAEIAKGKNRTYIVKPEALSQGKGIFLTKTFDNIGPNDRYVVQRYIRKPYLIDGLKFDLRIYALVYGCDPLRIYIYKEGLCRLATEEYVAPSSENLDNLYMHLTNYAINKNSKKFVFNADAENPTVGHKRNLDCVWKYVDSHGGNSKRLQRKIRRCIVKTLCAVQPQLARVYHSCQPSDTENNMCFEVLGFDILLDHKMKPWLLEVNHSPSFTTDTPFDHKVKLALLSDVTKLLRMDPGRRIEYFEKEQARINSWAYTRTASEKITKEEREEMREIAMQERDRYELKNCGGFTRIYPDEKMQEKYDSFIEYAGREQDHFYGFNKKSNLIEAQQKSKIQPKNSMPKEIGAAYKIPQSVQKALNSGTISRPKTGDPKNRRGASIPPNENFKNPPQPKVNKERLSQVTAIYGPTMKTKEQEKMNKSMRSVLQDKKDFMNKDNNSARKVSKADIKILGCATKEDLKIFDPKLDLDRQRPMTSIIKPTMNINLMGNGNARPIFSKYKNSEAYFFYLII